MKIDKEGADRGYFVTGTDTGVGKTLVACALLRGFARQGRSVIGMKPVAAGTLITAEGRQHGDVTALVSASTVRAAAALINPYCFEPAIAPHIAAAMAGVQIDLERIAGAYAELARQAELVIVEGAGGFAVPLSATENTIDLARRLGLPIIMVVGMRLGCLNHALLTADVIRAHGLRLAGWVANHIDPQMLHAGENVGALRERLGAPLVGSLSYMTTPTPEHAAEQLDLSALVEVR
jgi:dethiobiotin synthetase